MEICGNLIRLLEEKMMQLSASQLAQEKLEFMWDREFKLVWVCFFLPNKSVGETWGKGTAKPRDTQLSGLWLFLNLLRGKLLPWLCWASCWCDSLLPSRPHVWLRGFPGLPEPSAPSQLWWRGWAHSSTQELPRGLQPSPVNLRVC